MVEIIPVDKKKADQGHYGYGYNLGDVKWFVTEYPVTINDFSIFYSIAEKYEFIHLIDRVRIQYVEEDLCDEVGYERYYQIENPDGTLRDIDALDTIILRECVRACLLDFEDILNQWVVYGHEDELDGFKECFKKYRGSNELNTELEYLIEKEHALMTIYLESYRLNYISNLEETTNPHPLIPFLNSIRVYEEKNELWLKSAEDGIRYYTTGYFDALKPVNLEEEYDAEHLKEFEDFKKLESSLTKEDFELGKERLGITRVAPIYDEDDEDYELLKDWLYYQRVMYFE